MQKKKEIKSVLLNKTGRHQLDQPILGFSRCVSYCLATCMTPVHGLVRTERVTGLSLFIVSI